jgi:glycosyltransferase involved in cell wall biosynthesis
MTRTFSDLTLLSLMNVYVWGLKEYTNSVAPYFCNNYVFVKYNPLMELGQLVPLPAFKNYFSRYKKDTLIDQTNKPENVTIYPINVLYYPSDSQFKKLGEIQYTQMDRMIRRKQLSFDLIHAHFTWPQGYSGARIKEKYDVPLVVTARGYDIYDLPFRDEEWTAKISDVLNAADHVITVSQKNVESLRRLNIRTPYSIVSNGYSPGNFYPRDVSACRRQLGLPADKKIIITAGNLEEVKGHPILVEAMARVVAERKDVLCYIIGGGKLKKQLDDQIAKLHLGDHVFLTGVLTHPELAVWMNASDLFVLPSHKEGNPKVMFEALGCGKPFIGTRVGAVPDIITRDDYGLLVEPNDAGLLAEALLNAVDREWDSATIAGYAENYTWARLAQHTLSIYDQVLDKA